MTEIKPIQNDYVTVKQHLGVINHGDGYAIVNIHTGECMARNISSFLDCVKTIDYILGDQPLQKQQAKTRRTKRRSSSNILDGLEVYDRCIVGKIENIKKHIDRQSDCYGKLVNWHSGGFWHYGIGLSDNYIFDLGENLDVFHKGDREIKFVKKVRHFSPDKTIKRLAHALCCFKDWHYGLLGWNCEHYSRLVATNVAICYQVKNSPLAFLNHGGYHPTAVQDFTDYLNNLGLFELTRFEN